MWYILYMNKDVIYIEPEDDITDIIAKIENAKSKIVALVPPKKAGVFRSLVNIKLIAKASSGAGKTSVLVTTDPAIMKLAGSVKIPVAKNLQSAPVIPKNGADISETAKEELDEETDGKVVAEEKVEDDDEAEDKTDGKKVDEAAEDEAGDEEGKTDSKTDEDETKADNKDDVKTNDAKKDKLKVKHSNNKFVNWVHGHKKPLIIGGSIGAVLILFMIWAFVIAPSVKLTVEIKTELNNFSENITFTNKLEEEDADTGKFYLDEKKIESTKKVEFEATGQKNVGAKASGNVVVYTFFKGTEGGSVLIKAGSTFTFNGLGFVSTEDATLSWDGKTASKCDNNGQASAFTSGCQISGRVKISAVEPGTKYNIAASNSGWHTNASVAVYSDSAMGGGTDEMVTVVSEDDFKKAKEELDKLDQADNRETLMSEIDDNMMIIESSFSQTTEDAVSAPAIGEKVEDGTKPTLTAKTTALIYAIDKTKVEEFIRAKAKLGDDQKIYEIRDPFIENFIKTDSGYTGKLKTSYTTGPMVTENSIIEIVKGKGLGEAQHDVRDINGITSVRIDPSFPWVTTIPGDPNRITVNLEVKE